MALKEYSPVVQHWGTWLTAWDWQVFGTGTFRFEVKEDAALKHMQSFARRFCKQSGVKLGYFASVEGRLSGVDLAGSGTHLHFIGVSNSRSDLIPTMTRLWQEMYGNVDVRQFDPMRSGTFYVAKHIHSNGGNYAIEHMKAFPRREVSVSQSVRVSAYVPDHLREKTSGTYLRCNEGSS
jgi:hypothetical protein